MQPIFVASCGLGSSFIKILHTAYHKQKFIQLKKVPESIEKSDDLRYDPYYLNRLNSDPKSSQIRRKKLKPGEKTMKRYDSAKNLLTDSESDDETSGKLQKKNFLGKK